MGRAHQSLECANRQRDAPCLRCRRYQPFALQRGCRTGSSLHHAPGGGGASLRRKPKSINRLRIGEEMKDTFQAIGGTAGCQKLSEAFYARVKRDPVLRPLFPGKTLKYAIEEFASFMVQYLRGPHEGTQHRRG